MNYEAQIAELTKRIEFLEKAENKRIAKKKRETTFKVIKSLSIIILLFIGYVYINNNFIKPYQEKINYVNQKVDSVESFVTDKWDALQKYNPFIK